MANLYTTVKDQFPEFVRNDYPAFVEFVQAYYKWLELYSIDKLDNVVDIDTQIVVVKLTNNLEPFNLAQWLDREIVGSTSQARGFVRSTGEPNSLYIQYITADAVFVAGEVVTVDYGGDFNPVTAKVLSAETAPSEFILYFKRCLDAYDMFGDATPFTVRYLKNIKEIYAAKGSQQALAFLLKTVYNADTIVRYPSENVLRASDGKWSQTRHTTVNRIFGTLPENLTEVFLVRGGATLRINITQSEVIDSTTVRLYFEQAVDIFDNDLVQYINNGVVAYAARVIPAPSFISVEDPGSDWQLGQIVRFTGTSKDTIARISSTDRTTGQIKNVEILEFGFDHTIDQSITVYPNTLNTPGTEATLVIKTAATGRLPGRWADQSGQISNQEIRLEDNFYYQQFSYDIESEVNPAQFLTLANTVHPSGTKIFTTYNMVRSLVFTPVIEITYPYKTVAVFDVVNAVEDLSFEMIKLATPSTVDVVDAISFSVDKYLPEDTVSAVTGDSPALVVGSSYDSEEYFEFPLDPADRYVSLEKILSLT